MVEVSDSDDGVDVGTGDEEKLMVDVVAESIDGADDGISEVSLVVAVDEETGAWALLLSNDVVDASSVLLDVVVIERDAGAAGMELYDASVHGTVIVVFTVS
jgi:hypothetical protein